MDKINENISPPEAKGNEDENLPSATSTNMKNDDSSEAGDSAGISPPEESKFNETSENKQKISDVNSSDLQRENDTKTPEELIEEVKDEVDKMKITENQFLIVDTNESLKNVLVYNNSDSSDAEELESEILDEPLTSNKQEQPAKDADCSSSESETDSSSEGSEVAPENNKSKPKDSDSSDSESDSACTLSSDSDSDDDNSDAESVVDLENEHIQTINKSNNKGAVKKTYISSVNITGFEESDCVPIPDISNLNINEEVEFAPIGTISHIVAEIATVTVIPGTPAFDLDSMLFIEHENVKKPMGPIFDVIGPVANPIYCVRFNSGEDIKKMGLKSGTKVFCAPNSEEFTKFVFLPELLKMKYSDASYRNDTEVPVDMAEYSDDEKEREARRKKVGAKRKINDNSLERHQKYEQSMNKSNNLYTKLCKLGDNRKKDLLIPPEFDPTVPPPGFGQVYSDPVNYHYPTNSMLMQTQSMYEYYRASLQAMQNTNAYASELDFAHQFVPPPPRDYNASQNQQPPPSVNNYLCQSFTNNGRNNKGPGPSSQPF